MALEECKCIITTELSNFFTRTIIDYKYIVGGETMDMNFHYPPDILALLIDTIPRLNKTKSDLILFFTNVGVPDKYLAKHKKTLSSDSKEFNKFHVTRDVLAGINNNTDELLGIRRAILHRVIHFDSYELCWENDRAKARANVAELSKIAKMKDTITKIEDFALQEQQRKAQQNRIASEKIAQKKTEYERIKQNFEALFLIKDPQKRGKSLEAVLNALFAFFGIAIKESFMIFDEDSGKNYEQIDGVVEIKNRITIVEMKWKSEPIGSDKINRFFPRMFLRDDIDGIMISYSSYTETGIKQADDALSKLTIALVDLKDVFEILSLNKDLKVYFEEVIKNAKLYKRSKKPISIGGLPDINYRMLVT